MKNVEIYLCPQYREENSHFEWRCHFTESVIGDEIYYRVDIPISGCCIGPNIHTDASKRLDPLPQVHIGKKCDYILTIRDDDIARQLVDSVNGCEGISAKAVECYSSREINELPLATPAFSAPQK